MPLQISIIGCGHVGLVTGACLAHIGHQVACADKDESLVTALKAGHSPIYEPHLEALVAQGIHEGRLTFTTNSPEAIRSGDVIFLCVGVPLQETGEAELSMVDSVVRLIATESRSEKLVVVRSTVPVQTRQKIKQLLDVYGRQAVQRFRVAANPQFLREGSAVEGFLHPDRILVGVNETESERQLRDLYRPILERHFPCPVHGSTCPPLPPPAFLVATLESAELIKHASNAFLAVRISYANMIGDLCERLGGDVEQVTHAIGLDRRIGPSFLEAGLGFGGLRLPRDLRALALLGDRLGIDCELLRAAERVNLQRIDLMVEKMRRALWVIKDKRVGMLGLSVKPGTDDVRSSPAIELLRRLLAEGASVRAYDPSATAKTHALFPAMVPCKGPAAAAQDADALVIATEWEEFRTLDWARIRDAMARPLLFDGRNLLDPNQMKSVGFEYHSVGRAE